MSLNKPVRPHSDCCTGVIGASWQLNILRAVRCDRPDPAPNAETNLRKYVDEAWPALTDIALSAGASRERLAFTSNMKEALSKADFVQENGPERPDSRSSSSPTWTMPRRRIQLLRRAHRG